MLIRPIAALAVVSMFLSAEAFAAPTARVVCVDEGGTIGEIKKELVVQGSEYEMLGEIGTDRSGAQVLVGLRGNLQGAALMKLQSLGLIRVQDGQAPEVAHTRGAYARLGEPIQLEIAESTSTLACDITLNAGR